MQSKLIKKLFVCFNQIFKRCKMFLEGSASFDGCTVAGVRFTTKKLFLHLNVTFILKRLYVAGQITIGKGKGLF